VAVDAGDRAVMRLKGVARCAGLGSVPCPGIRHAILAADNKVVGATADERETSCSDRPRLVVLQLHRILRCRQHVKTPEAHLAIGRDGCEAVSIGSADDVDAVHGMGVASGRKRRPLRRSSTPIADVPQHHLAGVCPSDHQVGVEWRKACRHDGRLAVKYVFR